MNDKEAALLRTLKSRKEALGEECSSTLRVMRELAVYYLEHKRWSEALPLFLKILEARKSDTIETPSLTLQAIIDIANVYSLQDKLDLARQYYEDALELSFQLNGDSSIDSAAIFNSLGVIFDREKNYKKAHINYQKALSIREKRLPPYHLDIAQSCRNLGWMKRLAEQYEEATSLLTRTCNIREGLLGCAHSLTLEAYYDLADTHQLREDYAAASCCYQKALIASKELHGPKHLEVAWVLNLLGVMAYRLNDIDSAEKHYLEALNIHECQTDPDDIAKARVLSNLAEILGDGKDLERAAALHQQALDIRCNSLGRFHDSTLDTIFSLAAIFVSLAKYDSALALLKPVLPYFEAKKGKEHPDTAWLHNRLGVVYYRSKDLCQAERHYRYAVDIRRQKLGNVHPDTAIALSNLGWIYFDNSEYQRAATIFKEVYETCFFHFGLNHLMTLEALQDLALVTLKQQDYTTAEVLYLRATAITKKLKGESHEDLVELLNHHAKTLIELKKFDHAEALYRRGLSILDEQEGENHILLVITLQNLANLCSSQGKLIEAAKHHSSLLQLYDEATHTAEEMITSLSALADINVRLHNFEKAASLYAKAIERTEDVFGPSHIKTAWLRNRLGVVFFRMGSLKLAEIQYRLAVKIRKRKLGCRHLETATAINNLAQVCSERGNALEALHLFRQAFEIRNGLLGPIHPDTVESRFALIETSIDSGDFSTAEMLYLEYAANLEKVCSGETSDLANVFLSLAMLLMKREQFSEAKRYGMRSLLIRQKMVQNSDEMASTLLCLARIEHGHGNCSRARELYEETLELIKNNEALRSNFEITLRCELALIEQEVGDYSAAIKHAKEALSYGEQLLGIHSTELYKPLQLLSVLYLETNQYEEAAKKLERLVSIIENSEGSDSVQAARVNSQLANVYCEGGKVEVALELYSCALETFTNKLGMEDRETLYVLEELAALHYRKGSLLQAELFMKRYLRTIRKLRGDKSPKTCRAQLNLAKIYEAKKQFVKAERLIKQGLINSKKSLSKIDTTYLLLLEKLGWLFQSQGNAQQAEETLQEAINDSIKHYGTFHEQTCQLMVSVGLFYRANEKAKAELYFRRALTIQEELLGTKHIDTIRTMGLLAMQLLDNGELKQAEQTFERTIALRKQVCGSDHPETLTAMTNLAVLHTVQGAKEKAEELYRSVLEITEKLYGACHPATIERMLSLASIYEELGKIKEAEELRQMAKEANKGQFN